MRSTITIILLSFLPLFSVAQTCLERLQAAQAKYDEGLIHDLVDEFQATWGTCLNDPAPTQNPFTVEDKVAAYRLLILVYLQLDEPEKSDEYMLKLLATDPGRWADQLDVMPTALSLKSFMAADS